VLQQKLVCLIKDVHKERPFVHIDQANDAIGIEDGRGATFFDWYVF
jgi:hypothetical protein